MARTAFAIYSILLVIILIVFVFESFTGLSLWLALPLVLIGVPAIVWLAVLLYGLVRRLQPYRAFDPDEQQSDAQTLGAEGRYVTMPDGRVVEYLVYGSKDPAAKVIVQIHGASTSAGWMCRMYGPLLESLNLTGIAPSLPGYGFSDIQAGRRIRDFPQDLSVILEAEAVEHFLVEGISLGTAHAMAVAWHFGPERCLGLGLNVPYLSEAICREFNFQHDADKLPKADAQHWYQAWNFYVADLMFIAPGIAPIARWMRLLLPEGKQVRAERPWVFETMVEDQARLVIRGTQGQAYDQYAYEMNALWGFDPRDIEVNNVAVWYALDDSACPPEHGKWLAELFDAREDVETNVRAETLGFGHFTYTPASGPAFTEDERTLAKALVALVDAQ